MKTPVLFVAILATGSALAAPDPRLEQALSTNVISQVERSVQFGRTLPQVERPAKPVVDHGEMLEVRNDVFIDRRLVSDNQTRDNEPAIRVFPRDLR